MGNCISSLHATVPSGVAQVTQEPVPQIIPAVQLPVAELGQGLMPPALGQRRLLENLPHGVLLDVVAHLQDGHEMVRNINGLASLSATLRKAITEIPRGNDVLAKFHLLDRLKKNIDRSINDLAATSHPAPIPYFDGCGPILGLLTPQLRTQLVQGAIGLDNLVDRGAAIAELAMGMTNLSESDRLILVEAAINIHGSGGTHWDRKLGSATALAGLLEGPDCLGHASRTRIISSATALIQSGSNHFNSASIEGLGKAIRFLPDYTRQALVNTVINAADGPQRSLALAGMGRCLAGDISMNAGGRIVEKTLAIGNDQHRANAIGGLAAGMVSMEPEQQRLFVGAALGFTNQLFSASVDEKLGAATEYLTEDERAILVSRATGSTENHPSRFTRVCGLAVGMAHLSAEQCDALARTAIGFVWAEHRANAIGAIGQAGLRYLTDTRREELVVAALSFGNQNNIPHFDAITGLGAGIEHLTDSQRNRLIEAVSSITNPVVNVVQENTAVKLGALSALSAMAAAVCADAPPSR
jgi:hypothetical protein